MKELLFRACIELTNHRLSSFLLKSFTGSKISKSFVPIFSKTYQLNENEMDQPLSEYGHLHALFTRKLKPGSRPIDGTKDSLVSPVDGVVSQSGILKDKTTFHVKGQTYNIIEMLGSIEAAEPYSNGKYIILYLSPSHYHRIHSPVSGEILNQWTLGGRSYPVNEYGLRFGKRPLSRNYRVITELSVRGKRLAIIKVGAQNVNTIELTHSNKELKKGEEIGYFSFGSTVVMLAEEGLMKDSDIILEHVKVGEKLGVLNV